MATNRALGEAKRNKKDEFYTQLTDIENELCHYSGHFRGKTVFCNCDDPFESSFFKYFALNFNYLGLKKLICTCYSGSPVAGEQLSLFDDDVTYNEQGGGRRNQKPYKAVVNAVHDTTGGGGIDLFDVATLFRTGENTLEELEGDGDFRSAECVELLKEADIVVTNPPFSLFREYVAQLVKFEKKFLIIGNQNAITYKEIFPLIQRNMVWLGSAMSYIAFTVPDHYEERTTRFWIDEQGKKWRSLGNACWYTNMEHRRRHEPLILYRNYTPEAYPKYDNYDAIEVSKTADIPCDYDGVMGVPITFLDKYCPEQFEIVGATESEGKGFSNGLWAPGSKTAQPMRGGERLYKRIFIRLKDRGI